MVKITNDFGKNYYNVNNPKYIVVHYTGNAETTAKATASYFKNCKTASAHYVVDSTSIYRCIPENKGAWHAGNKPMNQQSIGIEICCHKLDKTKQNASDTDWYFDIGTLNNVLDLIQDIRNRYGITPDNIIRHYDVTGKVCPAPFVHNTAAWNTFKQHIINGTRYGVQAEIIDEQFPKYRVTITDLNIRKGPSVLNKVVAVCPPGIYTITEKKGNWGKLKSGAGWINLKYAQEVK